MRIRPALGCSKPAISRRQVVLPDPEGPSKAKNSPGAMSRSTPSTARTAPKWRETPSKVTADVMARPRPQRRPTPARPGSSPADHADIVGYPAIIGHAFALTGAFGHRRAPELHLLEIVEPVGLAALVGEQRIAFAGRRHGRVGAEIGRHVALQLG